MLPLEPFPIGAEGAQSRPEGGNLSLIHGAALITLVTVAVAPGAVSADEPGEAHAIVEAGTSHGAVVGTWERRQSYSMSLLRLGELGQGAGARLTLVPPPHLTGNWGLFADAVGRWANEGPLSVKPMGGIALAAPGALWPPRIRAGAEVGLAAIRGWVGLEAGLTVGYAFPPSRALEGEWVISAGVGVLFGFGASASAPVASRRNARSESSSCRQPIRWWKRSLEPPPWAASTRAKGAGRPLNAFRPSPKARVP